MDANQRIVCLFHKDCFDGTGAAWAVRQRYPNAEFIAVSYGDPIPEAVVDANVIIVDFSYPYEKMVDMAQRARHLIVLDHHISALVAVERLLETYPEKVQGVFDTTHSGAYLAWVFFHSDKPVPALIAHVEDRDLHRYAIPDTAAFTEALGNFSLDVEVWHQEFELFFTGNELEQSLLQKRLITQGQSLLIRKAIEVERVISQTLRYIDIFGHSDIPLVNAPRSIASDAMNSLTKNYPFVMGYYDDATHRVFSMRGHANCGLLLNAYAETMGGGGHPLACGFRVPRDHPLAQI